MVLEKKRNRKRKIENLTRTQTQNPAQPETKTQPSPAHHFPLPFFPSPAQGGPASPRGPSNLGPTRALAPALKPSCARSASRSAQLAPQPSPASVARRAHRPADRETPPVIPLLFPSTHRPHPSPPPRSSGWPPFALTPRSAALFLKLDPPGTLIPTPQPPHTLAAAASALRAEQSSLRRRGRKAPLRHSPTGVAQRPRLDARSTPRRPEARGRSPSSPTPSSARSAAAGPRRQHCCAGPSLDYELGEHHLILLVLLR